ncbi:TetR/AcrR family transcriptional regulator [Brevibacterium casei]|uniref:TetR/AcrR family transcriptional regulator n=1 Tax=Brevibacterium casei TaxID=33889 RepID=A0A7T4DJ78_9MICO|nr:TetR/AcrR family transcriptional regulator [Brevibacterium casei]QQB15337.1 TetR/AcrR family transcriptional regulator [Brevibacterium casei]
MPKIVDHAARRTEIVHALWLVIYTRGIDAVTFRAVADAAEISIGRVQHYFPSREALVLEGCRQLVAGAEIDDEAELVDEAGDGSGEMEEAGDVAGADPVDALRTFVRAFIPAGEAMRVGASVWFTYVAKAVGDPLIAEIVVDNDRRTAEAAARRVARVLARGSEAGQVAVGAEPATEAAVRLVALAKGLAQDVMLEVRTPEAAYGILDREIAGIATASAQD